MLCLKVKARFVSVQIIFLFLYIQKKPKKQTKKPGLAMVPYIQWNYTMCSIFTIICFIYILRMKNVMSEHTVVVYSK